MGKSSLTKGSAGWHSRRRGIMLDKVHAAIQGIFGRKGELIDWGTDDMPSFLDGLYDSKPGVIRLKSMGNQPKVVWCYLGGAITIMKARIVDHTVCAGAQDKELPVMDNR